MLATAALLTTLVAAAPPAPAPAAEVSEAPRPRWDLNAAVWTGSPAIITQGLGLGAVVEGQRSLSKLWAPAFVSARLGWAVASTANVAWIIDHHQFVGALGLGASTSVGVGRVWAQAGGGAVGIYEVLSRHQIERIANAGVPGGTERAFSMGPHAFAEAGICLELRENMKAFLAGGPWLFRTVVDGTGVVHAGGFGRLGVAYDF